MYPAVLAKFMRSVDSLCFEEGPDYAAMRNLLMEEVRAEADSQDEDGEDEVFVNLEIRSARAQDRLGTYEFLPSAYGVAVRSMRADFFHQFFGHM